MSGHILAIDAGTTSVKVCLFSQDLRMLRKSVQEYSLDTCGTQVTCPAETYLSAVERGARAVLAEGPEVAAIGLTGQGETLTLVDEAGTPLMPFLVWLDQRADAEAAALQRQLPEALFWQETGLPGMTGALPLAKVCWLRDHQPELFSQAYKLLLLEDYLTYCLTGCMVTEPTQQTSTGWYSLLRDSWWPDALASAGLPRSMLPELVEPGTVVGGLSPEGARRLGLPEGIPVCAGAMDQTAASWAVEQAFPGAVSETTGTALVTAVSVPLADSRADRPHTTLYRHIQPDMALLLPIGATGGMALTWLRDKLAPGSGYEQLTRLAEDVPPGAGGLCFQPFLEGMVDPVSCPEMRGSFSGLSLSSGLPEMTRAVLEGVAHQLRQFLDLMKIHGWTGESVVSLGGGARSALWRQIKADICATDILTLDCEEMAALGAALLAARGAGAVPNEYTPQLQVDSRLTPNPDLMPIYQRQHDRFLYLQEALRRWASAEEVNR